MVAEIDIVSCTIKKKKESLTHSLDFENQDEPSVLRNEHAILRIQKTKQTKNQLFLNIKRRT